MQAERQLYYHIAVTVEYENQTASWILHVCISWFDDGPQQAESDRRFASKHEAEDYGFKLAEEWVMRGHKNNN